MSAPRRLSTIGSNPLDAVVPRGGGQPHPVRRCQRLTVDVPAALMERVRDAVYWTPGLTVTELVRSALEAQLTNLENAHGGPFSARLAPLSQGRPVT